MTVISLLDFEDEELLSIKADREVGEYCWTCTPSTILYAIESYNLPSCTYLEADLYFWNSPELLLNELGKKSVLITQHRFSPEYDQALTSGKYCVQFMTFKNNEEGLTALRWWRRECIKWCYARLEDGKFGDQKYLDDWLTRFNGVHELEHLGGGVAPWNIQKYKIELKGSNLFGIEKSSGTNFPVVFYHFHEFSFTTPNKLEFGGYRFSQDQINLIYKPYVQHLERVNQQLIQRFGDNNFHGISKKIMNLKNLIRILKRKILSKYNVFSLKDFK